MGFATLKILVYDFQKWMTHVRLLMIFQNQSYLTSSRCFNPAKNCHHQSSLDRTIDAIWNY